MSTSIHPSAFIASSAQIGDNVTIGPCVCIEDNVIIGDNTQIHPFASVKQFTELGKNNEIHSYSVIGGVPQDLKFAGEESWLRVGDNNKIREFSSLHRGTEGGGKETVIGNNNLLMAYTHVAHDCRLGNNIVLSNGATLAGHVTVEDYAIIAGLSAVHQFARIGRSAFVGGMTGISQDLPPFMLAVGDRAGIHGPNIVGLRRMGATSSTVTAVRAAFRLIWLSGMPRKEALAKAEQDYAHVPEVLTIVQFVRESPRGVLPAQRDVKEKDNA